MCWAQDASRRSADQDCLQSDLLSWSAAINEHICTSESPAIDPCVHAGSWLFARQATGRHLQGCGNQAFKLYTMPLSNKQLECCARQRDARSSRPAARRCTSDHHLKSSRYRPLYFIHPRPPLFQYFVHSAFEVGEESIRFRTLSKA